MIDARNELDRLCKERGVDYLALSRMLNRNAAYIQQFIKRGSPRKLEEDDRRTLAQFFGVKEETLGGRPEADVKGTGAVLHKIPKLDVGASAGAGAVVNDEKAHTNFGFEARWLRTLSKNPESLSMIEVEGESMLPALADGDDIMVDRNDAGSKIRDGIYVIRFQDSLMVKRLELRNGGKKISVLSDNPVHQSWLDRTPDEVTVIGRVVWVGRKLKK